MPFVSLHVDGTEGAGGTEVLAGSATYAAFRVDYRYLLGFLIFRMAWHHLYGTRRAMAGTVATLHTVSHGDAIPSSPYSVSYLCRRFLCPGYRADSSCGAHFGAFRTLRTAIASLVGHFRLHQPCQVGGRTKHLVGANRHAKLASRAMLCHVAYAQCSRRNDGRFPMGNLFVYNGGQSTVHFLFLCFQNGGNRHYRRGSKKAPTAFVLCLGHCGRNGIVCFLLLFPDVVRLCLACRPMACVGDGSVLALAYAVHASHASAIVYRMLLGVDAGGLAVACAQRICCIFPRLW